MQGPSPSAVKENEKACKPQRRIYEIGTGVKRNFFKSSAELYRTARGGEIYSGCRWTLWNCESSTRTALSTVFVLLLLYPEQPRSAVACCSTSSRSTGAIKHLFRYRYEVQCALSQSERGRAPNQISVMTDYVAGGQLELRHHAARIRRSQFDHVT